MGDFSILWSDGIIQIAFHVSTMMLLKDDDVNTKKRHLGNDSTIIVYNESGEEYQFNMMRVNNDFFVLFLGYKVKLLNL